MVSDLCQPTLTLDPKVVKTLFSLSPSILLYFLLFFSFLASCCLLRSKAVDKGTKPVPKCLFPRGLLIVVRKKLQYIVLCFSSGSLLWLCFWVTLPCQARIALFRGLQRFTSLVIHQMGWDWEKTLLLSHLQEALPGCTQCEVYIAKPTWLLFCRSHSTVAEI